MLKIGIVLLSVWATATVHAGIFGSKCKDVPSHLCARVYDDEDCKGWELDIPVGEIQFKMWHPVYYWYRNDIEAISVRAGCTLTGFEDSSFNGESVTIRAGSSVRHVNLGDEDEYEDLDEDIESIQCSCR